MPPRTRASEPETASALPPALDGGAAVDLDELPGDPGTESEVREEPPPVNAGSGGGAHSLRSGQAPAAGFAVYGMGLTKDKNLPPPRRAPEMKYREADETGMDGKPLIDKKTSQPLRKRWCSTYPVTLYTRDKVTQEDGTVTNHRIVATPAEWELAMADGFRELTALVPDAKDEYGQSLMEDPNAARPVHAERKRILELGMQPWPAPPAQKVAAEKLVAALTGMTQ